MNTLLAILVASTQTLYVAKVPSFACTSPNEIARLVSLRSDPKSLQMELLQQTFQGECLSITEGSTVQGVVDPANASILRVDEQIDPPGYLSPAADFELKQGDVKSSNSQASRP